jgi:hypothetical protein
MAHSHCKNWEDKGKQIRKKDKISLFLVPSELRNVFWAEENPWNK